MAGLTGRHASEWQSNTSIFFGEDRCISHLRAGAVRLPVVVLSWRDGGSLLQGRTHLTVRTGLVANPYHSLVANPGPPRLTHRQATVEYMYRVPVSVPVLTPSVATEGRPVRDGEQINSHHVGIRYVIPIEDRQSGYSILAGLANLR